MAAQILSSAERPWLDGAVWRADVLASGPGAQAEVWPSGYAGLDAELPGGGWPVGAMSEILQAPRCHHEWQLLLPALRGVSRTLALVAPPHQPFGPALAAQGLALQHLLWIRADALVQRCWAAELALRCAEVAALLLWLPGRHLDAVRPELLRRLQLSAQTHRKLLWVMRPLDAQHSASPAVLRLQLDPAGPLASADAAPNDLSVRLLKRRGPPLERSVRLPAPVTPLGDVLRLSKPLHAWQAVHPLPLRPCAQRTSDGSAAVAESAVVCPAAPRASNRHALDRLAAAA